jgi:hypothetical protein
MIESLLSAFEQPESQKDLSNIKETGLLDKSVAESPSQDWSKPWTEFISESKKTNMEDGANSLMVEFNEKELDEPWSSVDKDFFDNLRTRNEGLEGQNHPETGVPYERKEVVTDTGEVFEGVFPQFDSKCDVQLPENLEQASDAKQFAECNRQLKEKCDNDPEFRKTFSEDQLDDIAHGQTPEGYTWHHSEEKGKMQLVDSDTHMRTGHTGGRNIWGGGTENRH